MSTCVLHLVKIMQDSFTATVSWITHHQRLLHSVFWLNHGPQSEGTALLRFKVNLGHFRPACLSRIPAGNQSARAVCINGNMIRPFSRWTSLTSYSDFILCADVNLLPSCVVEFAYQGHGLHVSNKFPSFALLWHAFCENAYRVILRASCARGKWSEEERQSVRVISGTVESFSDKFSVTGLQRSGSFENSFG